MKLWKCDVVGVPDTVVVPVVVMAETRQQAIKKASAKLPGVLGQAFPDDDRRFAQLGPDILDNMEEMPDEVMVIVVGLPFLENGTETPHT
jgi:hypothetical protein